MRGHSVNEQLLLLGFGRYYRPVWRFLQINREGAARFFVGFFDKLTTCAIIEVYSIFEYSFIE
jgi:hypothetical protein